MPEFPTCAEAISAPAMEMIVKQTIGRIITVQDLFSLRNGKTSEAREGKLGH
jgi:hypothetical protein